MQTTELGIIVAAVLLVVSTGLVLVRFWGKAPAKAKQLPAPAPTAAAKMKATGARTKESPAKSDGGYVYADLSPYLYFQWLDDDVQRFRAVGWLIKNSPYQRGKADSASFQKLHALLSDPWSVVCLPRRLECPFCPIINPDHGKKKQPWWAIQRGVADGLDLIHLHTPETRAHMETYCLLKSGANVSHESSSLLVPGEGCIYVAHAMIAHFVDAHGYAPPAEFWEAVRKCPAMNSNAYLEALIANGPRNKNWVAAVWAGSMLKHPAPLD
ncbi:MAG TPA: hypothetical protein VJW51_08410 [Candidatus Acidoferrales bacterium]|nr:hypothetical protein [Candidatus Acidoferrales bacterium]